MKSFFIGLLCFISLGVGLAIITYVDQARFDAELKNLQNRYNEMYPIKSITRFETENLQLYDRQKVYQANDCQIVQLISYNDRTGKEHIQNLVICKKEPYDD